MATWKRREVLRSWACGALYLGPATGATLAPSTARAADLNTQERFDWIYDHRLSLTPHGEGGVRIGLATGLTEVTIRSVRPVALGLSPHQGSRIQGGTSWSFRVHRGKAAALAHSLQLASLERADRAQFPARKALWHARGLEGHLDEQGTLLGLSGKVLDSRRQNLLAGTWQNLAQAQAIAQKIGRKHHQDIGITSRIIHRPQGWIVAQNAKARTEIRAQGAVWVFGQGTPLEIEVRDQKGVRWLSRGRHFRGALYVALDANGKLCVVNELSETQALMGVVPAEIPANAPMSALRAQAIAARGQLFSKVGHRHHADPFSLCADVHCQAYSGFAVEHPATSAAVKSSKGILLMRPDQRRLVDTVYSANSGGYSEHNEFVWPGQPDPQLRGTPDAKLPRGFSSGIDEGNLEQWLSHRPSAHCRPPAASHNDVYRWQRNLDLRKIVASSAWPLPRGKVTEFSVTKRGVSGRATQVAVRIDGQRHLLDGELNIRRALGSLRSSMFIAKLDGSILHVKGGGFGHGVGLCQYGAMGMAKAGADHKKILQHYYRAAKLVPFWT